MKRKRKYRLRAVMALLMALSILFSFKNSVFANEPQEIDAKSVESIEIANADDISYENDLKEAKNITDLDLESIVKQILAFLKIEMVLLIIHLLVKLR